MNRNRFTTMRSMDRSQEPGLQQILQPSATGQLPNQGGNQAQQTVRRKTTYTRTELLLRGLPTTQNPRRSPRRAGPYGHNNTAQSPTGPQTPLPTPTVTNVTPTPQRQRSYLPRVTRLHQMADDKSPHRTPNPRLRTENDTKPEPVQTKATPRATPRVPNTPHASDCSIPGPGAGHRTIRPEGCGIPVLDRSRNRERVLEQREQREQRERETKVDRKVDLVISDTSRSSSPAERHKMKLAKPTIRLPGDQQNKSFVYLCKPVKKVKELLTARRLRHSCEHLELAGFGEDKVESQLQKTNSEALLHSKAVEQGLELSSITEMSLTSTSSSASQLQLSLPHRQLLQEEPPNGLNQERLESQLTEVRQRQRYLCQKEQREKEMDLVCQNLPTLQHEIRLLQELSEKLETTLRVSNVSKQKNGSSYDLDRQSSTIFYTPRTGPMLFEEQPLVRMGYVRKEQLAKISQRAGMMATVLNVGVVREFRIENKTLNELKSTDESQCFYLPAPSAQSARQEHLAIRDVAEGNPPPLQCTNIRMLRENPGVLLQQLRRGSGGGGGGSSFNIIDHDMFMFLNSLAKKSSDGDYLYSRLSVGLPPKEISPGYQAPYLQPQEVQELPAKKSCEQVNSTTQTEEPLPKKKAKRENLHPPKEANNPHIPDLVQTTKPTKKETRKQQQPLPVLGSTRKARIIKMSPIQSNVEPKVRMKLFKTVLVGLVQVAIFLVLIMAFIYPDVSC